MLAGQALATTLDAAPLLLLVLMEEFSARQRCAPRMAGSMVCQIAFVSIITAELANVAPGVRQPSDQSLCHASSSLVT